jgi:hypothetical protein
MPPDAAGCATGCALAPGRGMYYVHRNWMRKMESCRVIMLEMANGLKCECECEPTFYYTTPAQHT